MNPAILCTPRDWQLSEMRKSTDLLGTPESNHHLQASKRFGLCADVIEHQARVIAQLRADLEAATSSHGGSTSCLDGGTLSC